MTRFYSSTAQPTTLSAACTDVATTIQVTATTGFPAVEFILALDYGTSQQELVKVTAVAGTTLTVVRGFDSTTAQAHSLGAAVRHVHSADDFRLSRTHEATSSGVHGVTGAVVGTTDAQALSNKDLSAGTNTFPGTLATLSGAQTLTNKTIALGSNTVSGTLAQLNTAVTDADLASLAGAETLTNKTVSLGSNTVSGTTAQFNAALSDNDFATLAGSETLTNKTLTSPTVTGLTLDGVNVSGSWTDYTPTAGNFTVGNGTLTGRYMQIGPKTILVRINFVSGTTSSYTTTDATVSLPVAANATGIQTLGAFMNNNLAGVGHIAAGASAATPRFSSSTTNPLLSGVQTSSFNPGAGTGGFFVLEGIYEAA